MRRSNPPRRGIRTIIVICAAGIAAAVAFVAPALACTWPTPGGGSWPVHTAPPEVCQRGSCIQLPTCGHGGCGNDTKSPSCKPGGCGNGTKSPTCKPGGCGSAPSAAPGRSGSSGAGGSGGDTTVPPSDQTTTQPVPSATSSSGSGSLPVTGVNVIAIVGGAASLLGTGTALYYVARRRRVTFTA